MNDVVVTKRAAWFTDSVRQFLYKVPIGRHGRLGPAQSIPLTGDIVYQAGFNVNGIDATPNGKTLIIVQTNTAKLFKVNRQRRRAHEIDARRRDGARGRAPAARAGRSTPSSAARRTESSCSGSARTSGLGRSLRTITACGPR